MESSLKIGSSIGLPISSSTVKLNQCHKNKVGYRFRFDGSRSIVKICAITPNGSVSPSSSHEVSLSVPFFLKKINFYSYFHCSLCSVEENWHLGNHPLDIQLLVSSAISFHFHLLVLLYSGFSLSFWLLMGQNLSLCVACFNYMFLFSGNDRCI